MCGRYFQWVEYASSSLNWLLETAVDMDAGMKGKRSWHGRRANGAHAIFVVARWFFYCRVGVVEQYELQIF